MQKISGCETEQKKENKREKDNGQPENDAEALRVIGEAFPDRDIIPIDARTIIRQHGSIHCLTMQLPK